MNKELKRIERSMRFSQWAAVVSVILAILIGITSLVTKPEPQEEVGLGGEVTECVGGGK